MNFLVLWDLKFSDWIRFPAQMAEPRVLASNFPQCSTQAVIKAAYLQVFGRDVYEGQRLKVWEVKLRTVKLLSVTLSGR